MFRNQLHVRASESGGLCSLIELLGCETKTACQGWQVEADPSFSKLTDLAEYSLVRLVGGRAVVLPWRMHCLKLSLSADGSSNSH